MMREMKVTRTEPLRRLRVELAGYGDLETQLEDLRMAILENFVEVRMIYASNSGDLILDVPLDLVQAVEDHLSKFAVDYAFGFVAADEV